MTTLTAAVDIEPAVPLPGRSGRFRPPLIVAIVAMLVIFLVTAISLAQAKIPWCDEGWFANPAYNLAFHGNMGTDVLEPSGHYLNAYLSGIERHMYVVPPLYLVNLAGWYRLFGFSLLSTRVFSLFWAFVALAALFSLVLSLTRRPWLAFFSAALTSLDVLFLWGAVDGRMDMMCSALGLTAIAVYLLLRERNLNHAIFWSHGFAAAALLTHPNAIAAITVLLYLTYLLDRAKLRGHHLLVAGAPYFIFFLAWLPYILQSPSDFRAQFLANAAGPGAARLTALRKPWTLLVGEISKYFTAYGVYPEWSGPMNRWAKFIPAIYLTAAGVCIFSRKIRTDAASRLLLGSALVYLAAVTVLIGFKAQNYLVLSLPWNGALLALALPRLWQSHTSNRLLAAFLGVNFLWMQGAAVVEKLQRDDYHRQYLPVVRLARQYVSEGRHVVASAAFGFDIPFNEFRDDVRLGLYSGVRPDVVVVEPVYRFWYGHLAKNEPKVQAYTSELLNRSRLVRHEELIDVYDVTSRPERAH